jgi:hypothetical protein
MGNWDRSLGAAPLLSSKLTHVMSAGNYANSFRHFNLSYADTGLWGVHLVSENVRSFPRPVSIASTTDLPSITVFFL